MSTSTLEYLFVDRMIDSQDMIFMVDCKFGRKFLMILLL